MIEHFLFFCVQFNLDDFLNALGADYNGHTDIQALDAIFAVQFGRARQNGFLSLRKLSAIAIALAAGA